MKRRSIALILGVLILFSASSCVVDWGKIIGSIGDIIKELPIDPPVIPPIIPPVIPPEPPVKPSEPPGPGDQLEGKFFTRIGPNGKFGGGGLLIKSLGSNEYLGEVYYEWNLVYTQPVKVTINDSGSQWFFTDSLGAARYIIDSNPAYW